MEVRGQEFKRWTYPVNDIVLREVQKQERNIAIPNEHQRTDIFVTINEVLEKTLQILSEFVNENSESVRLPDNILDWLKFRRLYEEWQMTRKGISSIAGDITRNQAYFQIVGMGPAALPFIFSHLEDEVRAGEPDLWFPALNAITGVDPVPREDRGRITRMAHAWLEWARREGYLYAEGMGKGVSQSR
jgi:hypothetical protein